MEAGTSRFAQHVRALPARLPLRGQACRTAARRVAVCAGPPLRATDASRSIAITVKGLETPEGSQAVTDALERVEGVAAVAPRDNGSFVVTTDERVGVDALLDQIRALGADYRPFPYATHTWTWQGHACNYAEAGPPGAPVLVCVHGFGASVGHFRKVMAGLATDYHVYALDLIGFGASAKPAGLNYDPYLWQLQLADFLREVVGRPAILVGNSIGSQVSLYTTKCAPELVSGLVLLNCTGGMNQKGLYGDDARLRLALPLFALIEMALKLPAVATWAFDNFRSRERVAMLLRYAESPVYLNPDAVDDELLDILTEPAADPGAKNVFVQVFTGDPGPRPEASMEGVSCPLQVQWGAADPWTPLDGVVACFFKRLAEERAGQVQFVVLPDTGHCPQDDRPEMVLDAIRPWLRRVVGGGSSEHEE